MGRNFGNILEIFHNVRKYPPQTMTWFVSVGSFRLCRRIRRRPRPSSEIVVGYPHCIVFFEWISAHFERKSDWQPGESKSGHRKATKYSGGKNFGIFPAIWKYFRKFHHPWNPFPEIIHRVRISRILFWILQMFCFNLRNISTVDQVFHNICQHFSKLPCHLEVSRVPDTSLANRKTLAKLFSGCLEWFTGFYFVDYGFLLSTK